MTQTTYCVGIDAAYDLSVAGYDRDEADDFRAAWTNALEAVAAYAGLEVEAVPCRCDGDTEGQTETPIESRSAHGRDTVEGLLWQAAHDCLSREEGSGWWYDESIAEAKGKAIAQRLTK